MRELYSFKALGMFLEGPHVSKEGIATIFGHFSLLAMLKYFFGTIPFLNDSID